VSTVTNRREKKSRPRCATTIRFSEQEWHDAAGMAKADGVAVAVLIRLLLRQEKRRRDG